MTINGSGISFRFVRDSTPLYTAGVGYSVYNHSAAPIHVSYSALEIDSPSSTSAITYKVQARGYDADLVTINIEGYFNKTLIATEIAG